MKDPLYHNWTFAAEMRTRCDDAGIRWGVWAQRQHTVDAVASVERGCATFACPNIEDRADSDIFDPLAFRAAHPTLECAVATTFSAFYTDDWKHPSPERAKPYVDARMTCMGEAYWNANKQATPTNMVTAARQRGWPGATILLGMWDEAGQPPVSFADYEPLLDELYEAEGIAFWGLYLLENCRDASDRQRIREYIAAH